MSPLAAAATARGRTALSAQAPFMRPSDGCPIRATLTEVGLARCGPAAMTCSIWVAHHRAPRRSPRPGGRAGGRCPGAQARSTRKAREAAASSIATRLPRCRARVTIASEISGAADNERAAGQALPQSARRGRTSNRVITLNPLLTAARRALPTEIRFFGGSSCRPPASRHGSGTRPACGRPRDIWRPCPRLRSLFQA